MNQNSTNHGLQKESTPPPPHTHTNMEIRSVFDELFEEKIQELDHDIHKYNPTPELITKNISCTATWRRQNRITIGIDVIMEDTVGSKRSTSNMRSQFELQKKEKNCFLGGKNNTKILAEAKS